MDLRPKFNHANLHGDSLSGMSTVAIDTNEDGNQDGDPIDTYVTIEDGDTVTIDGEEYTEAFARKLIRKFINRAAKKQQKANIENIRAMPTDEDEE